MLREIEERRQNLTLPHERFVTEYLTTARYNATEAYRRVYGCAGHSAEVGASRLRKRPDVAAEIRKRFDEQMERVRLQAEIDGARRALRRRP
jgi:phage terminase small subunit